MADTIDSLSDFEVEVYNAGRGFTDAQAWLASQGMSAIQTVALAQCGWHDTDTGQHRGSFALVQIGGVLEDLVGERIRVTSVTGRSVYAYVFGRADVPLDLSLAYRAWVALALPSEQSLDVRVEVLA